MARGIYQRTETHRLALVYGAERRWAGWKGLAERAKARIRGVRNYAMWVIQHPTSHSARELELAKQRLIDADMLDKMLAGNHEGAMRAMTCKFSFRKGIKWQ